MLHQTGGSVFRLARLAMARALELASGEHALILYASCDKTATIALEEIARGKIAPAKKMTTPQTRPGEEHESL